MVTSESTNTDKGREGVKNPEIFADVQKSPVISAMVNGSAPLIVQNQLERIELLSTKITWILVQLSKSLFIVQFLARTKCKLITGLCCT